MTSGVLNLQVTHHLFPRLPRHNLRKAYEFSKAFAAEQGLDYAEFGFVQGNKNVLATLRGVADQVRIMGAAMKEEAKENVQARNGWMINDGSITVTAPTTKEAK